MREGGCVMQGAIGPSAANGRVGVVVRVGAWAEASVECDVRHALCMSESESVCEGLSGLCPHNIDHTRAPHTHTHASLPSRPTYTHTRSLPSHSPALPLCVYVCACVCLRSSLCLPVSNITRAHTITHQPSCCGGGRPSRWGWPRCLPDWATPGYWVSRPPPTHRPLRPAQ